MNLASTLKRRVVCVVSVVAIAACTSNADSTGSASNGPTAGAAELQQALGEDCANTTSPTERQKACSQALQSAELSASERAMLLVDRAAASLQLHQDDSATRDLDEAISLDPKNAWAYDFRGLAAFKKKDYEHAAVFFDTAIDLSPSMPEAYSDRGMLFIAIGEHEKAIPVLDKSIQLNSVRADPYYWRSLAHAQLGDQEQAESDLAKAKAIDPNIVERRGDPLVALKAPISSGNQEAFNACLRQNEPDQTIANCTAALANDLNNESRAGALILRALAYIDKDPAQPQLAFNDANSAVTLLPGSGYAYRTRGMAEWDLGRKDDAMADFSKAISLEPNEAAHWFIRGSHSELLGDKIAADKDYAKAVQLDPRMEAAVITVTLMRTVGTDGQRKQTTTEPTRTTLLCYDASGQSKWIYDFKCPDGYTPSTDR